MNIKYKLKEIYKGIFFVSIQDEYDLAMTFCRLQEYYESPFKQVRGKSFKMDDFQRMYAKKFGGGTFTYPADWAGFNVPGNIVNKFINTTFMDWGSEYDFVMEDIYAKITDHNNHPFYLIGSAPKDRETINHELCHALYYLDKDYRFKVNSIIDELDRGILEHFKSFLLVKGYSKNVLIDEVNAYICFDDDYLMSDMQKMNKSEKKNFDEIKTRLKGLFNSTIMVRKHIAK